MVSVSRSPRVWPTRLHPNTFIQLFSQKMQVLLLVIKLVIKQQQEEISHNHIQLLFALCTKTTRTHRMQRVVIVAELINVLPLDFPICMISLVKFVFTNWLHPPCVSQRYAISAQISPNLSRPSVSLPPTNRNLAPCNHSVARRHLH